MRLRTSAGMCTRPGATMVETNDLWKIDARLFRQYDSGEGWPFAACVACSVHPDLGRGKRNERSETGKVSATTFAKVAGTSVPRVMRFLAVWEAAAADGLVTPSADLTPGSAATLTPPTVGYAAYSKKVNAVPGARIERAARVLAAVKDTEQIVAALPAAVRAEVAAEVIKAAPADADKVITLASTAVQEAASRVTGIAMAELEKKKQEKEDKEKVAKKPTVEDRAKRLVTALEGVVKVLLEQESFEAADEVSQACVVIHEYIEQHLPKHEDFEGNQAAIVTALQFHG